MNLYMQLYSLVDLMKVVEDCDVLRRIIFIIAVCFRVPSYHPRHLQSKEVIQVSLPPLCCCYCRDTKSKGRSKDVLMCWLCPISHGLRVTQGLDIFGMKIRLTQAQIIRVKRRWNSVDSVIWDSHTNDSVTSSQLKHCNSVCLLLQHTCDSAHTVFIIRDRGLFSFISDFSSIPWLYFL